MGLNLTQLRERTKNLSISDDDLMLIFDLSTKAMTCSEFAVYVATKVSTGGTTLTIEYSIDGSTNWHATKVEADVYFKISVDAGANWIGPIKLGVIDVSVYQLLSNLRIAFQSTPDDTHYPSEKLVKDSLDSKINTSAISTSITTDAQSTTQIPSVKLIKDYADGLVVGLIDDRGNYNPTSTSAYPISGGSGTAGAINKGDLWYILVGGVLGSTVVKSGYSIRALIDSPGQTASNWGVLNVGLGYIPENTANKATDLSSNDNTHFPTTAAVNTGLSGKLSGTIGTAANNIVALNGDAKLPPVDGSLLTNLPTSSLPTSSLPVTTLSTTGNVIVDRSVSNEFIWSPTEVNSNLTTSNFTNNQEARVTIVSGLNNVLFPSTWYWQTNVPTLQGNGLDVIRLRKMTKTSERIFAWHEGYYIGATGNDAYTKLLLHFEELVDSSASNHTVTANPSSWKLDLTGGKFGAGCLKSLNNSQSFFGVGSGESIGTGDFAFDFWFKSVNSRSKFFVLRPFSNWGAEIAWDTYSSNRFNVQLGNYASLNSTATIDANDGNWHHIAFIRSGGYCSLLVDGVASNVVADSSSYTIGWDIVFNWNSGGDAPIYLDEFRISVGNGRFNPNGFTPPTMPYGN